MNQDTPGCGTTQTMGHGECATCGQSFYGSPWYCSACTMKAAIAAAVAAEREARQEAQRRLEALQERINHADKEKAQAVEAERERCAKLCDDAAKLFAMYGDEANPAAAHCAAAIRGN